MKDRAKKVIAFEPPCWCPDSAGTTSRLTMFNNDELVIENFRHVIYSDDERVSVKTRRGIYMGKDYRSLTTHPMK